MPKFIASERVSLENMETGEGWEAMFNPNQLTEQIDVNWTKQSVVGLSHQPLQYANTGNHAFTLDLFHRAGGVPNPTGDANSPFLVKGKVPGRGLRTAVEVRKFLLALAYPIQATSVGGGGPPRVLVAWPHHLSLICVVTTIQFKSTRFNVQGYAVDILASVGFEEIRDTRITSSEVRNLGTFRSEE